MKAFPPARPGTLEEAVDIQKFRQDDVDVESCQTILLSPLGPGALRVAVREFTPHSTPVHLLANLVHKPAGGVEHPELALSQ